MNNHNLSQANPTKIIFKAYTMGFFLLFAVIIGYQAILAVENSGNTTNAEKINTAGRQRMLSQRIGKNLLWLSQLQTPQNNSSVIHQIDADIALLTKNNESLKQSATAYPVLSKIDPELERHYAALMPPLLKMTIAAQQVKQLSASGKVDSVAMQQSLQDYLANGELFLANMDKVVYWYERKLQQHIDHLNTLSTGSAFAILLVMVFIGRYAIFRAVKLVKQLFAAAESHKELLELILHSTHEGIISINNSTQITFFNASAEAMFGYSRHEVLGQKITLLIPDFYTYRAQSIYLSDGKTEILGQKKDHTFFPLALKKCKDFSHEPHEFIAFIGDLTLQKEAKSALIRSEEQYRAVVEDQSELICRYDSAFRLTFVNKAYCDFFKKSKEQLVGTVFINDLADTVQEWFLQTHSALTPAAPYHHHEDSYISAGGNTEWMDWKTRAIFDKNKNLVEYQGVGCITTHKKQIELELMQATETAIDANQAKSRFLSNMSNELRIPLNAILGFAQLLETNEEESLTERQRQYLDHIHKAGDHLLGLIRKMLDLSKLELGDVSLRMEVTNLFDIIDDTLKLMQPVAAQKNIRLAEHFAAGQQPCYVFVDRVRLQQVILHLISNAIKYNYKDGYVSLEVKTTSNQYVTLTVIDGGFGISAPQITQLFKPFNRLSSESSGIEGAGIGLAVSKNLVEKMAGRIGVNSEVGSGSRFWITFPMVESVKKEEFLVNESLKNMPATHEKSALQKNR